MQNLFGEDVVVVDQKQLEKENKPQKYDLFKDFLSSINTKSGNVMEKDTEAEKDYSPWLMNKAMFQASGTELFAHTMNLNHHLDLRMQYDFYYHGLPKVRGRYDSWKKPEQINNIENVKAYYKCSSKKAREYMTILSDEDIAKINKRLFKGKKE